MELLIALDSNGAAKEVRLNPGKVNELLNIGDDFKAAAITNVRIAMMDQEQEVLGCHVEICGFTPELLLKTCRFYFVEMAWERLQMLKPRLSDYEKHKAELKQELRELHQCCRIVFTTKQPSVSELDGQVDYLQSLEDAIRCGQVSFIEHFTDTNINRERLATLLIAGMFESAQNDQDYKRLESVIHCVVPDYVLSENSTKKLYDGLEQMIGYVNSICD